ncbi:hypothetical protein GCM10022211_09980 [Sphingomonas humi]|uniref:GAF domain-containing protein n=2 Tax=Sphingomonas humi TaxID=335630 RepID=A0ABP7RRP9_9SPHN
MHALRLLAAATGSSIAQLCGGGGGLTLDFSLFSEDRHDPHGHLVNPALYGPENWRINSSGGARSIQDERHYAAYRSKRPWSFYDDAVSDLDLPFGCQSPLILEQNGGFVGLSLLRSSRNGPCSADTVAAFARVAHQAHRSTRVEIALGQERGENMLASLTTSSEFTLLLDRYGRLVAMTAAAEALFDGDIGLRLEGLEVRLSNPGEDRSLRAAMTRLLAGDAIDGPVVHECRAGATDVRPQGHWRLFLTRLPANRDVIGVEAQLAITLRPLLSA